MEQNGFIILIAAFIAAYVIKIILKTSDGKTIFGDSIKKMVNRMAGLVDDIEDIPLDAPSPFSIVHLYGKRVIQTDPIPELEEGEWIAVTRSKDKSILSKPGCVGIISIPTAVPDKVRCTVSRLQGCIINEDGNYIFRAAKGSNAKSYLKTDRGTWEEITRLPLSSMVGHEIDMGDHSIRILSEDADWEDADRTVVGSKHNGARSAKAEDDFDSYDLDSDFN